LRQEIVSRKLVRIITWVDWEILPHDDDDDDDDDDVDTRENSEDSIHKMRSVV